MALNRQVEGSIPSASTRKPQSLKQMSIREIGAIMGVRSITKVRSNDQKTALITGHKSVISLALRIIKQQHHDL